LQALPCVGVQLAVIDERSALGLARQVDVLGNGQVRHQVQFLVNDRDACRLCLKSGRELHRLALVGHDAVVRAVLTADDLHERRFAGAVLSANRVHLARA